MFVGGVEITKNIKLFIGAILFLIREIKCSNSHVDIYLSSFHPLSIQLSTIIVNIAVTNTYN